MNIAILKDFLSEFNIRQEIIDIVNTFPNLLSLSNPGNNFEGNWGNVNNGENKRGNRTFTLPENKCIAFGLNVLNKYDGNNNWLSSDGRAGEWAIAYHGVSAKMSNNTIDVINDIIANNFKAGGGQAYSSHDDACHPGRKVGVGVYCTPDLELQKVIQ
eukprot:jgi/Orpsp1_1/1185213/evm.model.c7180000092808.2